MCREVILPSHPLDTEAAVLLRRQLTLLRHGQRRDGECPLNSAHIDALNTRRRCIEVERDGERRERRVGTLTIGVLFGLATNEPLLCVALSQSHDARPITTLRHAHLNATLSARRKELKDLRVAQLCSSRNRGWDLPCTCVVARSKACE